MKLDIRETDACRNEGITYHMAITSEWESQKSSAEYTPSAFAADGFIHCTNGLDLLIWVGNEFYKGADEPRTVLVLQVDSLTSDVRYDDDLQGFPHIYGPINVSAVIGQLSVQRGDDGAFEGFGAV